MAFNWQCNYAKRIRLDPSPLAYRLMRNLLPTKDALECNQKLLALNGGTEALGGHALFSLPLPLREQEASTIGVSGDWLGTV